MHGFRDIRSEYVSDALRLYSRRNPRYLERARRRRLSPMAAKVLGFVVSSVCGGVLFDALKALLGL